MKYMKNVIIVIAAVFAVSAFMLQAGTAVTNNTTSSSATASVRETISVTLSYPPSGTGIVFSNLDPGVNNATADNNLNISIDLGTNVATNISQRGDATFECGACVPVDNFTVDKLRYSNVTGNPGITSSTVMAVTADAPPYPDWAGVPKPVGTSTTRDSFYWLSIPNGQTAGSYTTNIYINVSKY